jgi:hypothetical protein
MIAISLALAITFSIVLDRAVLIGATSFDAPPLAILLNSIAILQVAVGAVIEWRRPGHAIGRLLMLAGPLFAFLAMGWTVASVLEEEVDPTLYALLDWGVTVLSYPGMAVIAGWLPLMFPTGTLPGPRWRLPAGIIVVISSVSLLALATRPGPLREGGPVNPFGVQVWPPFFQVLQQSLLLQLAVLCGLAVSGLVVRYRRGDTIERHQIRWLLASVAVVAAGFAGVTVESAIRTDGGISVFIVIAFVGFLLMPIAIGMAVLRYRLYEIDRLISRTVGWALVTGILVAVFAGLVVGLQALLASFTQGQTLAVAASTLVAFALFQPVRRRVQRAVDRRFDRARYDGERTAQAFAARLRDQVELRGLEADVTETVREALHPSSAGLWVRGGRIP